VEKDWILVLDWYGVVDSSTTLAVLLGSFRRFRSMEEEGRRALLAHDDAQACSRSGF
jgi:hypothetical protein